MSFETVEQTVGRGFAAHQQGRFAEAIAVYGEVLAFNPNHADALNLSGSAKRSNGDLEGALALLTRAVAAAPDRADIALNLGNALSAGADYSGAAAAFEAALAIDPNYAEASANLGVAHGRAGRYGLAVPAYERALEIDPGHKVSLHNLGNALAEIGRLDDAAAALRRAIATYPELSEAHYNLSLALLRLGDYAAGFAEYEWRWQAPEFSSPRRHTDIADWDGRPFVGKTLLIHAEQGLGDTLQFVRLVRLAKSLGGEVVLEVPGSLVRMVSGVAGADRVIAQGQSFGAVDMQSPLLGLPHRLKLTLGSVGMAGAYLRAEPEREAFWRERLALDGARKAIGVVWRGNPNSPADRGRSLAGPDALAPFEALAGVRLIAVQRLEREELVEAATPSGWAVAGAPFLEHPGPDFDTGRDAFVDTAGVMAGLDLVVSMCTAPLHLAGALNVPAIVLLKAVPDWRWMTGREDSPWYPSVDLCRQSVAGEYGPVVQAAVGRARKRLGL